MATFPAVALPANNHEATRDAGDPATIQEREESEGWANQGDTLANKAANEIKELLLGVVLNGAGPLDSSEQYARARLSQSDGDAEVAIRRVIRETASYAGGTGFLTGVGGFVALPATLPANIIATTALNARMVGAIAYLRGWDLDDERVQALVLLVVAGSSAQGALSALGVKVGQQLTLVAIKKIPIQIIREINKRVGFMLIAKYGVKRASITLVRAVPVVGGVVGGSIDAGIAAAIGRVAKKVFPPTGAISVDSTGTSE